MENFVEKKVNKLTKKINSRQVETTIQTNGEGHLTAVRKKLRKIVLIINKKNISSIIILSINSRFEIYKRT